MDGNWERVSYGKKKDKLTRHDKKRINDNMTRLQDLDYTTRSAVYKSGAPDDDLDLAAYTQANGGGGSSGSNGGTHQSRGGDFSPRKSEPKQSGKSSGAGAAASDPKRRPANNMEVLQSLSLTRLEHAYQRSKDTIPDSPLAWLIDICAIIDLEMSYDKKEDWNRTDLNFPSNHLPNACRQFLVRLLEAVSDDVKRRFFLHACQRLVKQSERQAGAMGTRAVLQLALRLLPQMPGHDQCRLKLRELFDSARGTRAAFAALMWALGQTAYKDKATGLQVLIDCALPAGDGQLLATRWAAPELLDTLDDLTRDHHQQQQAAAKLSLRHAVALADAAAGSQPGQTRDRLVRALARLRPAWARLSATADAESARHLLEALRRWEAPPPPASEASSSTMKPPAQVVELAWQCLTDGLRASPALLASLPLLSNDEDSGRHGCGAAASPTDLRLVRLALSPSAQTGGDFAFGRQARLSLGARLAAASTPLPPDVANLVAAAAADAAAATGRRRGRGFGCGVLGRCCSALMSLASMLLIVAMVTACILYALAFVPRGRLPSFVQPAHDYLEDRLVLYHVRRLHSDCQVAYKQRVAPFLMRRWDELADIYHDTVLPKWAAARAAYKKHAEPQLAAAASATWDFYERRVQPQLHCAWHCVADSAAAAYGYVEAEMRLYMPNVLTAWAKAVDCCMNWVTEAVYYLSDGVKFVYYSLVPPASA